MSSKQICTQCGTVGFTKTVTKGSFLIELLLWLCFLIPGIIYSLWRLSSRHQACPACGHSTMVPVESPNGQRLMKSFNQ